MSEPERTPDGHHVVIDGRRWRATDPGLPEPVRVDLVGELMAARRAVGAAGDDARERAARARVQDAKVALGERGHPWWEPASDDQRRDRLAAVLRVLARRAAPEPIDPARAAEALEVPAELGHDVAADLVAGGELEGSGDGVRAGSGA